MGIVTLTNRKRAVFLDRDGVLNRNVFYADSGEWESPRIHADLTIAPAAVSALQELQAAEYLLFVVTNQPSCAKGKTSMDNLLAVKQEFSRYFTERGIVFTEEYYCFHHPKGIIAEYTKTCDCRKPSPFFLLQANECFAPDMAESWMIGDRDADVACGKAAGTKTIRVDPDHPDSGVKTSHPDYTAKDIQAAAGIILSGV